MTKQLTLVCGALGASTSSPSVASLGASGAGAAPMGYDLTTQTTFYIWGSFGTSSFASLQIWASPDSVSTPDNQSRWVPLFDLLLTSADLVGTVPVAGATLAIARTTNLNANKFLAQTIGGDSGTSLSAGMM